MNNIPEKSPEQNLDGINHVLNHLQNRGFFYLFKLKDECIYCKGYNIAFEEFDILESYSFELILTEGCCVLYAIKSDKYNIKGIVVNQTGDYANVFSNICISKILSNIDTIPLKFFPSDLYKQLSADPVKFL